MRNEGWYKLPQMLNLASRLVAILTSLRHAIAAHTARESRAQSVTWLGTQAYSPVTAPSQRPKLPAETWVLLYHRLNRLAARFTALFARWQTNTLPMPRLRAPRPYIPRETPRLPTTHGWINARIPEAAPCAGTLDILLQHSELPKFLTEAPQAGRLLRPLLRALGLQTPDCLKLPKPKLLSPRPPRVGWAAKRTDEGGSSHPPPGADRLAPPQTNKVFLLLFVHKKKTLPPCLQNLSGLTQC